MSRSAPYINEIVSITILLLMVIALVAGEADAKNHGHARLQAEAAEAAGAEVVEEARAPFRTTIRAHIDGHPLTISIDAVAELSYFRFEDE